MSNLIPVKRMDKNGHMVTRHVKADSLTAAAGPSIGAPVLKKQPKPMPQSDHVAFHNDPRVQNGEVIDRIIIEEKIYSRARDGVTPNDFSSMRVQFNRPLTEHDSDKIASIVGYAFKLAFRPQYGSVEVGDADSPYSVLLDADTYYSQTSDFRKGVQKFEEHLSVMMQEGTPLRTTERAGPGTKGTRLVKGFEDDSLKIEFYYDDVLGDEGMDVAKERGVDIEAIDTVLSHDVKPLAEGML